MSEEAATFEQTEADLQAVAHLQQGVRISQTGNRQGHRRAKRSRRTTPDRHLCSRPLSLGRSPGLAKTLMIRTVGRRA